MSDIATQAADTQLETSLYCSVATPTADNSSFSWNIALNDKV
jgi:hypothetical protein